MGRPSLDLSNFQNETMSVVGKAGSTKLGKVNWLCRCFCGNQYVRTGAHIVAGRGQHCGCLRGSHISAGRKSHKMTKTKEFRAWCGMKERCYTTTNKDYKSYGARGIKVCEKWYQSFESFFSDMGYAPSPKHSLDRVDVNGNYEPSNCRWATPKEQCSNKRNNIYIDHKTRHLLWDRFGNTPIYQRTLWRLKHKNMGIADAVFQPSGSI
jgi:hypothetical protein